MRFCETTHLGDERHEGFYHTTAFGYMRWQGSGHPIDSSDHQSAYPAYRSGTMLFPAEKSHPTGLCRWKAESKA